MNSTSRLPNSEPDQLPREMIDLAKEIAKLPAEQQPGLEAAYNRVIETVNRRRRILSLVQEALSQLRLDIKYLMFDLEVTRRERDELKKGLEE
ncbi:MAG: transcriptional regulator [Planctomycetaceae bacterium]|nr:transcriptional regulator [Planctomycetaceae bacterium]MBT6155895.1 transcriptional regulator [Planctomycetaceae bacterium]MBT6485318.1 transcriptional regulator [Planctomycetaceae bacterium]MBT6496623.1 transcriptional regulator [Planctomycetaceae bacterium]